MTSLAPRPARHAGRLRAPPASRARRAASRTSRSTAGAAASSRDRVASSNSTARARASIAGTSPQRHVERGVAAALARHGRVEQHRRHAGSQRLERRQAQAFVLGQKREGAGAARTAREARSSVTYSCQRTCRRALLRQSSAADPRAGSCGCRRRCRATRRGCARASGANARIRSTTCRRLKIEPTNKHARGLGAEAELGDS